MRFIVRNNPMELPSSFSPVPFLLSPRVSVSFAVPPVRLSAEVVGQLVEYDFKADGYPAAR